MGVCNPNINIITNESKWDQRALPPSPPLPNKLSRHLIGPGLAHERPISDRVAQAQRLYRRGDQRAWVQRKLGLEFAWLSINKRFHTWISLFLRGCSDPAGCTAAAAGSTTASSGSTTAFDSTAAARLLEVRSRRRNSNLQKLVLSTLPVIVFFLIHSICVSINLKKKKKKVC